MGEVTVADMLDAFPFRDKIWTLEMTGTQIREVLEQGFSLERGIIQVSGLEAIYHPAAPVGSRLIKLELAGVPVDDIKTYTVATIGVIAEGGDLYQTFTEAKVIENNGPYFADVLESYLRETGTIEIPPRGRLNIE